MKNRFRDFLTGLVLGMCFMVSLPAQQRIKPLPDLSYREQAMAIQRIGQLLIREYVFPDQAIKISRHLKKQLRKGVFRALREPAEFAKKVTQEMKSVFQDRHLRVRVRQPQRVQQQTDPILDQFLQDIRFKEENYSFKEVKILPENVGYLDFWSFGPVNQCRKVLAAAMAFLENTDAIIIDMRRNGGGSPRMVQMVCSYFFTQKVHLNSLYWRRGNVTQEFWTLDEVDGKKRGEVPLFILTSKRTFSGAEEFCYNMKTRKRAILVGEVTGGGANPGGTRVINKQLAIFIPTGKAINPVTKTNWEGVGVQPDIAVKASKAIYRANTEARKAARIYRAKKRARLTGIIKKMHDQLKQAQNFYQHEEIQKGNALLNKILKKGQVEELLAEDHINSLGYLCLRKKQIALAIAIFKYNVTAYPDSSNAYDSLGEAYKENGNLELAIKNYQKSVDLNPNNKAGAQILKQLKARVAEKKKQGMIRPAGKS